MDENDLPLSSSNSGVRRTPRRRAGENTPVVGPRSGGAARGAEGRERPVPVEDSTEVLPSVRSAARPADPAPRSTPKSAAAARTTGKSASSRPAAPSGAAPRAGASPAKAPTKGTFVRRRITVVLAAVLAAVLGVGGFVYCSFLNAVHDIPREANLLPEGQRGEKKVEGAMTILLAGTDRRQGQAGHGNSDTMMLMHLPADRKHIYLVSLPRDSWVPIPGDEWAKLNQAFNDGGPALATKTFETLMGIHIDHVALVDFEGFIQLTDALGGVEVDNPEETWTSNHYHWPKGKVKVQGDEALAFVRQRYSLSEGDLIRTQRQRAVIKAIINKALSAGVVANPAALTDLFERTSKTITLDDTFTDAEVRGLVTSLDVSGSGDIRSIMLPIAGYGKVGRAEINVVDGEELDRLSTAMREDRMEDYWRTFNPNQLFTYPRGTIFPEQPTGPVPDEGLPLSAFPTIEAPRNPRVTNTLP